MPCVMIDGAMYTVRVEREPFHEAVSTDAESRRMPVDWAEVHKALRAASLEQDSLPDLEPRTDTGGASKSDGVFSDAAVSDPGTSTDDEAPPGYSLLATRVNIRANARDLTAGARGPQLPDRALPTARRNHRMDSERR